MLVKSGVEQLLNVTLDRGVPVEVQVRGEIPWPELGEYVLYKVWREDGALLLSGRTRVPALKESWPIGNFAPEGYRVQIESSSFGVIAGQGEVPPAGKVVWVIEGRQE